MTRETGAAIDNGKRLSASSQSSNDHSSRATNDDKVGMSLPSTSVSDFSTPHLSDSQMSTPQTPASPMYRGNSDEKVKGSDAVEATGDKKLLTPTAALESLRALEHGFERSHPNSPLDGDFTKDSKLSQSTAVASPVKSTSADKDGDSIDTASVRPAPRKRNSSYRKSVPTLLDLELDRTGLGITNNSSKGSSSGASSSEHHPSSPSSTTPTETPSWISSLTTLEAIRVLAYQQSVGEAPVSDQSSAMLAEAATSADEVSALRYALNFTLLRADKLAETLNKVSEDKIKVETELETLRRNVLSMLGSQSMFPAPTSTSGEEHQERSQEVRSRPTSQSRRASKRALTRRLAQLRDLLALFVRRGPWQVLPRPVVVEVSVSRVCVRMPELLLLTLVPLSGTCPVAETQRQPTRPTLTKRTKMRTKTRSICSPSAVLLLVDLCPRYR